VEPSLKFPQVWVVVLVVLPAVVVVVLVVVVVVLVVVVVVLVLMSTLPQRLLHTRVLSAKAGATMVANNIAVTISTETIRRIMVTPFGRSSYQRGRVPPSSMPICMPIEEASGSSAIRLLR
jgi:hypothetical protein